MGPEAVERTVALCFRAFGSLVMMWRSQSFLFALLVKARAFVSRKLSL
jgi:hypothetical protein